MIRKLVMPVLVIFLLAAYSAKVESRQAANDDSTLMQLLALIPDTEHSRSDIIVFTDLEALDEAYGVQRPATWAEFESIDPDADEPEMLKLTAWWHIFRNTGLPGDIHQYLLSSEANTGLGFTYFEIDQAISFGRPLGTGLILVGDVNQDAVRAALQAKGYTQQEIAGAEVWCGAAGCEAGMDTNPATRDLGNPFGGNLGRIQPILIGETYLMSSAGIEVVENHIAATADEQDSLADSARYQAAVQAVSQEGTLLQAMIFDQPLLSEMLPGDLVGILGERATPEIAAEFIRTQLEGEYRDLPVFDLMIMADTVITDNQLVYVGLVYSNAADAQTAAEVIPARLETYQSIRTRQMFPEFMEDRRATAQEPTFYRDVDGATVVLFGFSTPRPSDLNELIAASESMTTPTDAGPDVTPPGRIFRLFRDMVYSRDLGWLSTVTRAQLETMLQELEGN